MSTCGDSYNIYSPFYYYVFLLRFLVPCPAWCPAAIITITIITRPAHTPTCSITRHRTRCTTTRCRRHRVSLANPLLHTRSTPTRIRRRIPLLLIMRRTRHPVLRAQVKIYNLYYCYYYYYLF